MKTVRMLVFGLGPFVLFGLILWQKHSELSDIKHAIQSVNPINIILIIALGIILHILHAINMRQVYISLNDTAPIRVIFKHQVRSFFISVVTFLGAPAGVTYYFYAMHKEGIAQKTFTIGQLIFFLFDMFVFGLLFFGVLGLSGTENLLSSGQLQTGLIALILFASLTIFFINVLKNRNAAIKSLTNINKFANSIFKFLNIKTWPKKNALQHAHEMSLIGQKIKAQPPLFIKIFFLLLFTNLFPIIILHLAVTSTGYQATTLTLFIAYVLSTFFVIVSPTPQGLGPAEIAMTGTLIQFGTPFASAVIITALFRLATFYTPLTLGALSPLIKTKSHILKEYN